MAKKINGIMSLGELQKDLERKLLGAKKRYSKRKEKKSILEEAQSLVSGDRMRDYAPPQINFDRISKIATVLVGKDLSAEDCVKVLIATKLGRLANGYKRDTVVDLAGYAYVLDMVHNAKEA